MGIRDIVAGIEDRQTKAKAELSGRIDAAKLAIESIASHLATEGLRLDAKAENVLEKAYAALEKEKAKLDAELAPKPAPAEADPDA